MLIDTHAHMNSERYDEDRDTIIKDFKNSGIKKVINVSYDLKSCKDNLELANKYDSCYVAFGIHPHNASGYTKEFEEFVLENKDNKKLVAIGEIGLDYFRNLSPKEEQKKAFVSQMQLANKVGLPIIVHVRDSYGDTLEVLKQNKHLLNNSGVVHCFSGSLEFAKDVFKLGLKVSFGGPITFKNSKISERVISNLDLKDILLETDCPYLAPQAVRGQRNEPKHVKYVAENIADTFNLTVEEVEKQVNENAYAVFTKLR